MKVVTAIETAVKADEILGGLGVTMPLRVDYSAREVCHSGPAVEEIQLWLSNTSEEVDSGCSTRVRKLLAYERLYNSLLNYNLLKVFGCAFFVHWGYEAFYFFLNGWICWLVKYDNGGCY